MRKRQLKPGEPAEITPMTPRGEATKHKLLAAAEEEFGLKGFHMASVSSITTRADVGQGTFYLYFKTKEAIFTALVKEIGRNLRRFMAMAMSETQTRMEAERQALDAFIMFAKEHPGLYRIVQEAQFVDDKSYREYYERLATGYIRGLDNASQKGDLTEGDAESRAWAIMGIGHFLGLRYCLWQGKEPDEKAMKGTMDFIAYGMAPKA